MSRMKINDDMLEQVSGGMGIVSDDPQAYGRCPFDGAYLVKKGNGYVCPDCGQVFDKPQVGVTSGVKADSGNNPVVTSSLFVKKK
ncbi:MAG: hypothetical protein K6G03_08960 [Lachnospiraceae bacterium]|nr:hypothetical protein [Lachnospiraceae bacterium]